MVIPTVVFALGVSVFGIVVIGNFLILAYLEYKSFKSRYLYYGVRKDADGKEHYERIHYITNLKINKSQIKEIEVTPPTRLFDNLENFKRLGSALSMLSGIIGVVKYLSLYYDQGIYTRSDSVDAIWSIWVFYGILFIVYIGGFLKLTMAQLYTFNGPYMAILIQILISASFVSSVLSVGGVWWLWYGVAGGLIVIAGLNNFFVVFTLRHEGMTRKMMRYSMYICWLYVIFAVYTLVLIALAPELSNVIISYDNMYWIWLVQDTLLVLGFGAYFNYIGPLTEEQKHSTYISIVKSPNKKSRRGSNEITKRKTSSGTIRRKKIVPVYTVRPRQKRDEI